MSSNKSREGNRVKAEVKTQKSINVPEVVQGINQRMGRADKGRMDTGDYVLKMVFHGRLDEAQSRNPYKEKSLKQVSEDPQLLVDRRTLGTCVKAAHLKRTFMAESVDCSNLRYSHFAALLGVTEPARCRELAVEANSGPMSVRELTDKVKAEKRSGKDFGKAKALVKKMEAHSAFLETGDIRKLLEDPDEMERAFDSADRLLIAKAIEHVIPKLEASADILKRAKKMIATIELGGMKSAA